MLPIERFTGIMRHVLCISRLAWFITGIRGDISRAQDSLALDANAYRRHMPSPQTQPSAVLQRPAPACALLLAALVQCSYMDALAAGHTDRGGVVPAHCDQIKNLAFTVRRVLRRAVRRRGDEFTRGWSG